MEYLPPIGRHHIGIRHFLWWFYLLYGGSPDNRVGGSDQFETGLMDDMGNNVITIVTVRIVHDLVINAIEIIAEDSLGAYQQFFRESIQPRFTDGDDTQKIIELSSPDNSTKITVGLRVAMGSNMLKIIVVRF